METLEQLEKKVDDLVKKKYQEIAKVQAKLDKTIATIGKAKKDLATAKKEVDGDTYVKAKLTLEKATAEKELYSSVLDDMKNKPLLPDNEYKNLLSAIKNACDILQDDFISQSKTVVPKLRELSEQSSKTYRTTAELLEKVVIELFNTPDNKVIWNRDKDYYYHGDRGKAMFCNRYAKIEKWLDY